MEIKPIKQEESREDRLLSALADMQLESDRRYASVVRRVEQLENQSKGGFLDDDPLKGIIGVIVAITVIQMVAPIILDLVNAWRQSRSSPS